MMEPSLLRLVIGLLASRFPCFMHAVRVLCVVQHQNHEEIRFRFLISTATGL